MPKLYLISVPIEESAIHHIPPVTVDTLHGLSHFIVERTRTARRFIRKVIPTFDIDSSIFMELEKKDWKDNLARASEMLKKKHDIGIMSESGSPCVARSRA